MTRQNLAGGWRECCLQTALLEDVAGTRRFDADRILRERWPGTEPEQHQKVSYDFHRLKILRPAPVRIGSHCRYLKLYYRHSHWRPVKSLRANRQCMSTDDKANGEACSSTASIA
jgi:hypothetical protein